VFTITGSEVPNDIKVQILTISGKVVREITRAELGPLHIGNNITDFAWDGTDQHGDPLGNGVYLYKVVVQQNNQALDHYATPADKLQLFTSNQNYGKIYLLR
jgi:flagellar hook assembly protein FlgD